MNPETDQWTYKTLKEYFERVLLDRDRFQEERDRRYMQMFKSADDAIIKADAALREYKATANEVRGALKDQATTFMPRAEADNRFAQQAERIRSLELSERAGEGGTKATAAAKTNSQWIIGLLVVIALAAVGFFLKAH